MSRQQANAAVRPHEGTWLPWAMPMSADAPALHFAAECEIYAEGDAARSFYKLVSGVVRTCIFLNDGRRQIIAFHAAGEVFGVESGAVHRFSAEAVTPCSVVAYRRAGLEALAASDQRLAGQLFSYAMRCTERAQGHALVLGRRGAAQKLAAFLLELRDGGSEDRVIDLPMTRQDIGDYLGLTIETVSRTFSQFDRDGVIEMFSTRRVRLINTAALEELNA